MTEPRLDVLVSPALSWGQPKDGKELVALAEACDDWNLLLDSGAFTNWSTGEDVVTLDWYSGFLREHGSLFWRCFNLDVIGDHGASMGRLQQLRDDGLDPIPVFQRGGTRDDLVQLLDDNELVGIGGIAGVLNRPGDKAYLHQVMQIVGDRRDRIHLLGVGSLKTISAYRPLTADSGTAGAARRYGKAELWFGQRWQRTRKHDPPKPVLTAALASYGLSWETLREADAWKVRGAVYVAGLRAWIRYQRFIRRTLGTRLFIVDHPSLHESLVAAWQMEKERLTG